MALAQSLNASLKGQPGYAAEEKQQIEILYLERKDWAIYPEETATLAAEMSKIGQSIVLNVLKALQVDPNLYNEITGGLSDGQGKTYLKLAHYDATKDYVGLPWHKDIRWVTVLFINQEGLQGEVEDIVIDVKPLDGHFVVNLGAFFEAFINDAKKLKAFVHRVKRVKENRSSFGAFCEGNYPEIGFYQLHDGKLIWKQPNEMNDFLITDTSFTIPGHFIFGND